MVAARWHCKGGRNADDTNCCSVVVSAFCDNNHNGSATVQLALTTLFHTGCLRARALHDWSPFGEGFELSARCCDARFLPFAFSLLLLILCRFLSVPPNCQHTDGHTNTKAERIFYGTLERRSAPQLNVRSCNWQINFKPIIVCVQSKIIVVVVVVDVEAGG